VLCGVDLEFMDEDSAQLASLLMAYGWILGDSPDLLIQDLLLLFAEAADPLLKGAGLDDSHGGSTKLVFGGLALIEFLSPDQDILDDAVGQFRIIFRTLADPRPVLDLTGYRPVVDGTHETCFTY
jgi:hypothetical protein